MELPSLWECAAGFDRWAPALLDAAVRSVAVLGIAGLAAIIMRRNSAAARHWVWVLGFVGILLVPIFSAALPVWRVLPRLVVKENIPAVIGTASDSRGPVEVVSFAGEKQGSPAVALNVESTARAPKKAVASPVAPTSALASTIATSTMTSTHPPLSAISWQAWLVFVWLAGALLLLSYVALGHLSLWILLRGCTRGRDGHLRTLLTEIQGELSIRREVELLISPKRTMPMTWGLWHSRLLLPEQAAGWPAEQCRAVLLHELGHVSRRDCLTQLFAQIACAVYWFNPIVWVAWRRMQVERERACDDLVLNTGARASAYAENLLRSASAMPVLRFVGQAVAMARPSTLEERLRAILDARRNRGGLSSRGCATTVVLLLAAVIPVAVLRAQESAAPQRTDAQAAIVESDVATRPGAGAAVGRGGAISGRAGRSLGIGLGATTPQTSIGTGPMCTLDATVYDVRLPVDQIGRLDVDALTRASATPADFEKALSALGLTKPLYRANQAVRLGGDSITISTQAPYIASAGVSREGTVNVVPAWYNVGASFDLFGKTSASGIELDMAIRISAMSESAMAISPTVNAQAFRSARMAHKGMVEPLKPFVIVSVDAASVDADGKAVAYIARVTLGTPQMSAATMRGQ